MLDKTYSPKQFEQHWYDRWENTGSFACDPESRAEPYTIMMPPPNVTGSLHIGHALTFTLQDVLIRFYRMQGRDVLWQPGTDHAGIATQMVVERMLAAEGVDRRDLGRDAFINRVWEWKAESGGTISRQLRSLGASPDWARERFTMDEGLSHAVREVFVRLHEQGLIYRDKRLVNWDPKLLTAISDLEVEQKEVDGFYWHLRYPVEDGDGEMITVATTRPETMLGDTAVAVHPDDERYSHLIGRQLRLPITGRLIPVIADSYSDPEKGSGAVKITPAHDFNDFEVGRRHDLPMINIFDAEARLNETVPEGWQGLDRMEARKKVVAYFEEAGLLAEVEPTRHTVPHGDRSGVVIEPWLMDQWYADAATLAKPAIAAVEDGRTRIIPQRWEKTYFEWMRNIQPWCISRQLWWGHRIPAWYGPDGEVFVAMDAETAAEAATRHYGKPVELQQDEDVRDTWFSSGLWPFSTLGWPQDQSLTNRYYPGSVLVTGFDIIFFWVARMMMLGMHFMDGEVPFRDVYIHALVRDENGQKMSKSKGNVMDPLDISERYGADALRFTLVAMAAQGRDIKLAESRIEGYRNFATKLWNACRFLEMNGCLAAGETDAGLLKKPVNRWIMSALSRMEKTVSLAIQEYRFNDAADALYQFVWHEYCDWYLELIKPALADDAVAEDAKETRAVARQVVIHTLHILHPLMPYITEELWNKALGSETMLINASWPSPDTAEDISATEEIGLVIDLITDIRKLRSEMRVPSAARPELVITFAAADQQHWIDQNSAAIMRLARLSGITAANQPPEQAAQGVVQGVSYALPLAGILDFDAERIRLEKEIANAEKEIAKIEAKLANQGFLAKAPTEVVDENKRRLTVDKEHRASLVNALERLG